MRRFLYAWPLWGPVVGLFVLFALGIYLDERGERLDCEDACDALQGQYVTHGQYGCICDRMGERIVLDCDD